MHLPQRTQRYWNGRNNISRRAGIPACQSFPPPLTNEVIEKSNTQRTQRYFHSRAGIENCGTYKLRNCGIEKQKKHEPQSAQCSRKERKDISRRADIENCGIYKLWNCGIEKQNIYDRTVRTPCLHKYCGINKLWNCEIEKQRL
jgi:hypothetical protein